MRIIVFSDSHGDVLALRKIVENNIKAELFIFLGDKEDDIERVRQFYPMKKILNVKGNCDYNSFSSDVGVTIAEGKKIIYTHGHKHNVKNSLNNLFYMGKENNADILLFGHTHCRLSTYIDGMHILNPGSVSCPRDFKKPSYGYIDITKAGIVTGIVDIM